MIDNWATSLIASVNAFMFYEDATYKYYCTARPGTALTSAKWSIRRLTIATGRIEWAQGNANDCNPATSLAVVKGLSFS